MTVRKLLKETEEYPALPACALHALTKHCPAFLVEQIHKHFQNKTTPAHKDIWRASHQGNTCIECKWLLGQMVWNVIYFFLFVWQIHAERIKMMFTALSALLVWGVRLAVLAALYYPTVLLIGVSRSLLTMPRAANTPSLVRNGQCQQAWKVPLPGSHWCGRTT